MTKTADLSILIRDPEGNVMGNQNAIGTTDDDGVTVVVPLGYLTDIQNVPLSDLTFNVIPPAVPKTPTTVISRVDDVENNISTIVFGYEWNVANATNYAAVWPAYYWHSNNIESIKIFIK